MAVNHGADGAPARALIVLGRAHRTLARGFPGSRATYAGMWIRYPSTSDNLSERGAGNARTEIRERSHRVSPFDLRPGVARVAQIPEQGRVLPPRRAPSRSAPTRPPTKGPRPDKRSPRARAARVQGPSGRSAGAADHTSGPVRRPPSLPPAVDLEREQFFHSVQVTCSIAHGPLRDSASPSISAALSSTGVSQKWVRSSAAWSGSGPASQCLRSSRCMP